MSSWEAYTAKIRSTEASLQDKLQLLSKYSRLIDNSEFDVESPMDSYTNLRDDIVVLFKNYTSYLENMNTIANSTSNRSYYTIINRQKEVLREFKSEYKRLSERIQTKRERYDLLKPRTSFEMNDETDMQLLLKERNSTQSAIHLADEYLDQASASHQSLLHQRASLGSSRNKMLSIINRIPGVNSLMRSIQNRRNKDNIIVGSFIAVLVLFCIWYAWK